MGGTFACPGCREQFVVASPDGGELELHCPISECRRPIWLRDAPDGGFELSTASAPDLGAARFVLDQMRLLDAGVLLLTGPSDKLRELAEMLNALDPADIELPDLVREFMQAHGRGCTFLPGKALVLAGLAQKAANTKRHHD